MRPCRGRSGPRATRRACAPSRTRRACALRWSGRRSGTRRPLRALSRRLLRAGRRGLRDGPLRGVPLGEAGRHDLGRRRAAGGGHGPQNRLGLRAACGCARASVFLASYARRRGEGLGTKRKRDRAPRLVGRYDRAAAGVKVAYYSPLPPERSGIADYSALLLPSLERLLDVEIVRRGRTRPAAGDVAL